MERHDVPVRRVVAAAAAIATAVGAAVVTSLLLLHEGRLPPVADPVRPLPSSSPSPALQSAPQLDLSRGRDDKERQLHRLEWAEPGVVRMPIDTAMALMARRAASSP